MQSNKIVCDSLAMTGQKITVKLFDVHNGRQAIVGNIQEKSLMFIWHAIKQVEQIYSSYLVITDVKDAGEYTSEIAYGLAMVCR